MNISGVVFTAGKECNKKGSILLKRKIWYGKVKFIKV